MKHLIIGKGNLGLDLLETLKQANHEVEILGRGFSTRDLSKYDVIWCTAGAGGPSKDPEVFLKQVKAHVELPSVIVASAPKTTKLMFFSTHYLNNDPEGKMSGYALTKKVMEDVAKKHENATVFRVGSLYGSHYPNKTLPGKIIPKILAGEKVSLPANFVTPTSTKKLAKFLVRNMDSLGTDLIYSVGPNGSCSVFDWGMRICLSLGINMRNLQGRYCDPNYPAEATVHSDEMVSITFDGGDFLADWIIHGAPIFKPLKEVFKHPQNHQ